jgi:hypothetical protein
MATLTTDEVVRGVSERLYLISFSLKVFEQLYTADTPEAAREKLETMQRTTPAFFDVLRHVLADNVLLGLAVLCDPATSKVRKVTRDNLPLRGCSKNYKHKKPAVDRARQRSPTSKPTTRSLSRSAAASNSIEIVASPTPTPRRTLIQPRRFPAWSSRNSATRVNERFG